MPGYEMMSDEASDLSDGDWNGSGQTMPTACKPPVMITSASQAAVRVECDNNTTVSDARGKKRRRPTRAETIWPHSRKHFPGVEPERCDAGRRLWYCKICPRYSVSSTSGARAHMASVHSVTVADETLGGVKKAKYHDVRQLLCQQTLLKQQEAVASEKLALRAAANPALVEAAWIRLLIRHDLPHNSVCWPELHTFVHTINYLASDILPTSSAMVRSSITATFKQKQQYLKNLLQKREVAYSHYD